jgi:site-specific recombinase XerD
MSPPPLTLVQQWLHDLQSQDRSTNTVRSYRSGVRRFLMWYETEECRPLDLADLTPIALMTYRNALQHTQARATSSVNLQVAALRSWCAWLTDHGYLVTDPAARLRFIGQTGHTGPRGLKDREVNALLREAQRTRHPARDYAILQMLLQTGMRIGECAALRLYDVQFKERHGAVLIRGGKGNKARTVPLNGSIRKALAEYVAPRLGVAPSLEAVTAVWPRRQHPEDAAAVWLSQKGGALSMPAIRAMIDLLVRDCSSRGLVPPETSAHTLRHTFALSYLKQYPGDLIGLATLLGHSSLDTTRIYGQPSAEQLADRVDRLGLNAYDS